MGSFIGNNDFGTSYDNFKNGLSSSDTFVWESISAIGSDIGDKIYKNIRDYVDLVSNVDVCKVKSLKSIFKMYGLSYNIFDNYGKYPLEVQNLIDIFSISKKYVLKNDFLRDDFVEDMKSSGVLSSAQKEYTESGEIIEVSNILNQEMYELYIQNTFKTLLSDFLDLEYNDSSEENTIGTKIRTRLTEMDLNGYTISSYNVYKD